MNKDVLSDGCRVAFACVVVLSGCGERTLREQAAVRGKVTIDGQSIEDGEITFFPLELTRGLSAHARIRGGEYEISSQQGPGVGTNRVEIRCPQQKQGRWSETVPDKYNTRSTLQVEIVPGENEMDFKLQSD